ncbi:MAG TPA: hypothetical protein VFI27_20770 [candidate division Zixibacteria bacterium]|nr:hypothetical protein [candidate division Zixibacteria bacterium]
MAYGMIFLRIAAFILGLIIVFLAIRSAIRTLVLSRGIRDPLSSAFFVPVRKLFMFRANMAKTYEQKDSIMAYFAPVSLLTLPFVWLAFILIGFMSMFWALGIQDVQAAFTLSGSSLLTLGFAKPESVIQTIFVFFEAGIGLVMVALIIAYLPTMYGAFSRRETAVTLLDVRAGRPPSAVQMILRYHRNHGLEGLHESWKTWEVWFAELEESHTSLAALVFFRSAQPGHSWVTAAGTVLDAAALTLSVLDIPWDAQAALCMRSGYLALRRISDFFQISYDPDPVFPASPISISREEFDGTIELFKAAGIPIKEDRDRAWRDFGGWRINYDAVLLALCDLTMAPYAPWSSDRASQDALTPSLPKGS